MKNFTIVCSLFLAHIGFSQQVLIEDFQDPTNFTYAGFEGLASASIVADPVSGGTRGDGFQLVSQSSGNPWQGAELVLLNKVLNLTTDKTITLDVYSSETFNLLAKVETGGPASATAQTYNTPGVWQTLTFTFTNGLDGTATADGEYQKIVFFGNWNSTNTGFDAPGNFSFHIDNIFAEEGDVVTPVTPTEAAPTPPARDAADVVSLFSNAYTNINVATWGPDWGPFSGDITDLLIASNDTKKMRLEASQEFAGIDFIPSTFDATPFTHFHLDFWTADPILAGQTLNIKLSNHEGGNGETSAIQYNPVVTGGEWVSIDVPLADFVAASDPANLSRSSIAQIVINAARADNSLPVEFFFDNIYFYKNSSVGIDNLSSISNTVVVYPNPVNDQLSLKSENGIQSFKIYNFSGQFIAESSNVGTSFDVSDFNSGVYFIEVLFVDNTLSTIKFVK